MSSSVYIRMCVCVRNNFAVYTITRKILERSAPIFVGTLGLLASMNLHLGSVALTDTEVLRRGIRALRALLVQLQTTNSHAKTADNEWPSYSIFEVPRGSISIC